LEAVLLFDGFSIKKKNTVMRSLLSFIAASLVIPAAAQSIALNDTLHVSEYQQATGLPGRKQLLLHTGFADPYIDQPSKAASLKGKIIESVELVYTHYWQSPTFPQQSLNDKRLSSLRSAAPYLLTDPFISWKLVAQHPVSSSKARNLFHGFVITYRDEPTKESMKAEMKYIEDALSGKATADSHLMKEASFDSAAPRTGFDKKHVKKQKIAESSSSVIVPVFDIRHSTIPYMVNEDGTITWSVSSKDFIGKNHLLGIGGKLTGQTVTGKDTILFINSANPYFTYSEIKEEPAPVSGTAFFTYSWSVDSTVVKVLNRKKKEWKDMLIIGDLTGSMAPYSAQLLMWYKLNMLTGPVKKFVFFNDGNFKPDRDKVAGSTGGIYFTTSQLLDHVMEVARETMMNGGGGDCPENNVEATLAGLEKCPDCDAVVMIADNYATPRDLEFASKINKPLKIILCGANNGVNKEYLDLALKTGGSVHLMEQDLEELARINEGETIIIGKQEFRLEKGTFVHVFRQ
jgi:hypothetical protein